MTRVEELVAEIKALKAEWRDLTTLEQLREQADALGYDLVKRPDPGPPA